MIGEDFFTRPLEAVNMNGLVAQAVDINREDILDLNRSQLWDGKDATGSDITPSYLDDPFFKTKEAALKYMAWKAKITPNSKRNAKTPNMYINGSFYKSLSLNVDTEDFTIKTTSSLGSKIDSKFDNLEGLTKESLLVAGEYIREDLQLLFRGEVLK